MNFYEFEEFFDMAPVKRKRPGDSEADDDNDYRRKREKKNEAVKKSRVKSKLHTQDTFTRVKKLQKENQELEDTTKRLTRELKVLKDLLAATRDQTCS